MEANFLIGEHTAIEVKASKKISQRDLKGLKALQQEGIFENYLLVSQDPTRAVYGNFQAMHYTNFLDQLWNEEPKKSWSHP